MSLPNKTILIIEANFYQDIAYGLTEGATDVLEKAGYIYERITVPGCFEIPTTLAMAIDTNRYAGYIALGCVIRGQTTHYDHVCHESIQGLNRLAIKHRIPVGLGIITANNRKQAYARCASNTQNFGHRAANACLTMMRVKKQLAQP